MCVWGGPPKVTRAPYCTTGDRHSCVTLPLPYYPTSTNHFVKFYDVKIKKTCSDRSLVVKVQGRGPHPISHQTGVLTRPKREEKKTKQKVKMILRRLRSLKFPL